ncbi:MAG: trypsin-like serine peptidase [Pseudonocardiaceae bacterium]
MPNKALWLVGSALAVLATTAEPPQAAFTAEAATAPAASTPTDAIPSVGRLFTHLHGLDDRFNCTGTVLNSPKHDIVLTAKHCTGGIGKWAFAYFVPGYDTSARSPEPYGRWTVSGAYNGPGDLEVLVMDKKYGRNIQDVVGAQTYETDVSSGAGRVSVIGYPSDGHGRPYYCGAEATTHFWKGHTNQWQTDCGTNFNDGVSGSAYMIDYNPRTHQGTVVAALGGDHEGSAGLGGEFSLGDPLTGRFETFLQDVLDHHA